MGSSGDFGKAEEEVFHRGPPENGSTTNAGFDYKQHTANFGIRIPHKEGIKRRLLYRFSLVEMIEAAAFSARAECIIQKVPFL